MIAFEAEAARPALNGPGGPTGDQKGTEAIDVQDRQLGPRWNELEQPGGQRNDQNRAADADARRQGQIPPGLSSQRSLGVYIVKINHEQGEILKRFVKK